jgi:hypothetical protein
MHEDDVPIFWELMFLRFHGLHDKDSARVIGELLSARYGSPRQDLPDRMTSLLEKLDSAERNDLEKERC